MTKKLYLPFLMVLANIVCALMTSCSKKMGGVIQIISP